MVYTHCPARWYLHIDNFMLLCANMTAGFPHENSSRPEEARGPQDNPRIISLLGGAGLTAIDLQLFDRLHQQGMAVFAHGSIVVNRIRPQSDIDFTVIGHRKDMSSELRDTLMPGLEAAEEYSGSIDYISTSMRSQAGRKISLHISEPLFRAEYPRLDKPYATEYRPGQHAKTGARKYLLSGVDRDGGTQLINFLCQSHPVGQDGGTITDTPQTGLITLEGNTVYVGGNKHPSITAEEIVHLRSNGEIIDRESAISEEVMILGLEFDKMQSDTPVYIDPQAEGQFVKEPITRSMEAIGEFSGTDPSVMTRRLFDGLATHWHLFKPNKSR